MAAKSEPQHNQTDLEIDQKIDLTNSFTFGAGRSQKLKEVLNNQDMKPPIQNPDIQNPVPNVPILPENFEKILAQARSLQQANKFEEALDLLQNLIVHA